MRRVFFAVTGWLVAAGLAVAVGLLAVSLLGTGITAGRVQPLSHDAVARALDHSGSNSSSIPSSSTPSTPSTRPRSNPSVPPGPGPSTSSGPRPTSPSRTVKALHSPGGTVIARCTGNSLYLMSWTPRQGFEIDDHTRGPAHTAYIKFESDDADIHMSINCSDGTPESVTTTEPDD